MHPTDSNLPLVIKDAISNLWIGELDGEFYSCVMPLHAKPEEEQFSVNMRQIMTAFSL